MTPNIHKRKYHPYVPLAFHLNILPAQALNELPRSTKYDWRKKDLEQLAGHEYAVQQQEQLHTLSVIASNKHLLAINKALVKAMAIGRFIRNYRDAIKIGREPVANCVIRQIKRITPVMGLRKALKWCQLPYAQWRKLLTQQICTRSPFLLCRRKHPSQLLSSEISTLVAACHDPAYRAWPLSSIYHQLVRTRKLFCSLGSFYKYAAKLVNRPALPKSRRKHHHCGIRAEKPLQTLHADITLFRTTDGTINYIYFIQDNYSRAVLQYAVSTTKQAATLINMIRTVYNEYLENSFTPLTLITDGGAENKPIRNYFVNELPPLEHLIAQKDIIFSNAMIEHLNKTIKYRYLYQQPVNNLQHLEKMLQHAVHDYNNRPAHVLLGLTPLEALNNSTPDLNNTREAIRNAASNRIIINKADRCCL